ncbi:MAG: LPS biosynthesis glycosyltransferase [Cyanobacteria bacterium P01_H01_bin.58]
MDDYPLNKSIGKTIIVAYKEDTQQLEAVLRNEGLVCQVNRQVHQPEYKTYSPSYLCLLNHCNAWQIAAQEKQPTLIIEADFIPVKGVGNLPLPFDSDRADVGVAWLYTCAPQIYFVTPEDYAVGYSCSTVAYVVTPTAAQNLIDLADKIYADPGPTQYSSWDSSIEGFLRKRQLKCYVPWRNYGEHGGKPNPEHRKSGLSAAHRADVLYGSLAFKPLYAETQALPFGRIMLSRTQARAKGIARLLIGKYLRWKILKNNRSPFRMLKFSISRQLTLRV